MKWTRNNIFIKCQNYVVVLEVKKNGFVGPANFILKGYKNIEFSINKKEYCKEKAGI